MPGLWGCIGWGTVALGVGAVTKGTGQRLGSVGGWHSGGSEHGLLCPTSPCAGGRHGTEETGPTCWLGDVSGQEVTNGACPSLSAWRPLRMCDPNQGPPQLHLAVRPPALPGHPDPGKGPSPGGVAVCPPHPAPSGQHPQGQPPLGHHPHGHQEHHKEPHKEHHMEPHKGHHKEHHKGHH
ncbi:histidine-rich glycoprotein-like [Serinus canaria]|uniref:histidine-rich glycoprotein-like n=1 Tax=Serinus canaria TaxID=9135 RepID=UPI0021CD007C|nr:histidine-rich glycoprotein-like [Serinus canaria]